MTRNHTAERKLQGQPLSSFGASSCQLDQPRDPRIDRELRMLAELGSPVIRW